MVHSVADVPLVKAPDERLLQSQNCLRAEEIVRKIREKGRYRFGPMWAEHSVIANDRKVDIQASSEGSLVIHVFPSERDHMDRNFHWSRRRNGLVSYRAANGQTGRHVQSFNFADTQAQSRTSSQEFAERRLSKTLRTLKRPLAH
jgi:hypothetical protein